MKGTAGQLARAVKKLRVTWDERVKDPRDKRGQRHGHHGLLNLLVAGFAGAQTTLRRIEELSGDMTSLARRVLSLTRKVSDTTLYMLLGSQDPAGLRETLMGQVKSMLEKKQVKKDLFRLGVVAFDGKWVWTSTRHVIEGARVSLGEHAATSSLLAEKAVLVSSSARPILDLEAAGAKSGESPAFRRMFGRVAAAFGKSFDIVTADAGLTAKANAALVRKEGKHYLFALKGNQPCLHQMAHQALDAGPCEFSSKERRGGATISRSLSQASLGLLTMGMEDAQQLWRVVQRTCFDDGRVTEEVRHFVTSMPADFLKPEEKLGLVRLHWGIENGSHWPANVVLEEDRRHPCQLSRRAIEVVTWLRALAYNLLAARRAAQVKSSAPAWKRVALLVRDVLVAPHAEARAVFEA